MRNKQIKAIVLACAVAATAVFAGTYAWHSISQHATNEVRNILNPGGRLHDDFTGMNVRAADGKLKRVYVENYTEKDSGDRIYARIRLSEYLEIGVGAGKADENKQVTVLNNTQDNLKNKKNWTIYKWEHSEFRDYVNINIGDHTTSELATAAGSIGVQASVPYMPTYNKDKDSSEAEVNGTLGGIDKDEDTFLDAYQDYVPYGDGTGETVRMEPGIEIHAENEEGLDEVFIAGLTTESITKSALGTDGKFTNITSTVTNGVTSWSIALYKDNLTTYTIYPIIDHAPADATAAEDFTAVYVDLNYDEEADIRLELVEDHETQMTESTAKLISMEEWSALEGSDRIGNFWVYDTDGWAYWAQPIDPQTATGCLISGISINEKSGKKLADTEYYYGLHVVAQCATAADWGNDSKGAETGFFVDGITDNALRLLNTISRMNSHTVTVMYPDESTEVLTVEDGVISGEPSLGWENLFLTAYVDGKETDNLKETLAGLKRNATVTYAYTSKTTDTSDDQKGITVNADGTVVLECGTGNTATDVRQMMAAHVSDDYYVFQTTAKAEAFTDGSIGFALTVNDSLAHIGINKDGHLEIWAQNAGKDPEGMATFTLNGAQDWKNGVELVFVNNNGEFTMCVNGKRLASFRNDVSWTLDGEADEGNHGHLTNAIGVSVCESQKVSFTDYLYEAGKNTVVDYLSKLPRSLETAYLSADGNDLSAGTSSLPLGTLQCALSAVNDGGTIVVQGTYTVPAGFTWAESGKTITIQGNDSTLDLSAFSEFYIGNPVTFQDITLDLRTGAIVYANGHALEIAESVRISNVIKLFGGGNRTTVDSTNLTVKAGNYTYIYGGSNGGTVAGDVNLYVGGISNSSADPASHSKTYAVYGGGLNDTVNGIANLTFADSAKANYVYGGSGGTGKVGGTNVLFCGGQTMSLYGGNCASTKISSVNVKVSGGEIQQLFGGCEGAAMTGDVTLELTGGKITRRVYGGCYNEYNSNGWQGERYVKGQIHLKIAGGVTITFDAKDSNGSKYSDRSMYACSRYETKHADEICTITFMDQTAYDTYYSKLGAHDFAMWWIMGSVNDGGYDFLVKSYE